MLRHNKIDLALHHLRDGDGDGPVRRCCCSTASARRRRRGPPQWAAEWPGPVVALDFTGHGQSTVPPGGGYTAEIVLADADVALAELGSATLVGRGLGAYVALMLAGARPQQMRGAVLCDGPGLAGGADRSDVAELRHAGAQPTPSRSVRAVRAVARSASARLRDAVRAHGGRVVGPRRADRRVAAVVRPPWLAAVVDEIGVTTCSIGDALAMYAPTTA